jgi:hypothetical protein
MFRNNNILSKQAMNDRKYKCIVVTPAGRREYLEILAKHLESQKTDFDEWHLWKNTKNSDDIKWMETYCDNHDWAKIIDPDGSNPSKGSFNIHVFFSTTTDPNTIYIRLDDDVVWLDKQFIRNLYQARIDNPDYFLVYPNIINNAVITHIHQRTGAFDFTNEFVDYACTGNAWHNPYIAKELHTQFIASLSRGDITKWRKSFSRWITFCHERISINSFAYFGSVMAQVTVGHDEEQYLSCDYPREHKIYNLVVGSPICVHYAFYTQRSYLNESPSILDAYRTLAGFVVDDHVK